ncbi:MAG: hypothetical protein IT439_09120 [Phycisphaerales bacterium]|nr:hypothetical protein [Phycisphaerales bacterium]
MLGKACDSLRVAQRLNSAAAAGCIQRPHDQLTRELFCSFDPAPLSMHRDIGVETILLRESKIYRSRCLRLSASLTCDRKISLQPKPRQQRRYKARLEASLNRDTQTVLLDDRLRVAPFENKVVVVAIDWVAAYRFDGVCCKRLQDLGFDINGREENHILSNISDTVDATNELHALQHLGVFARALQIHEPIKLLSTRRRGGHQYRAEANDETAKRRNGETGTRAHTANYSNIGAVSSHILFQ